MDAEKTRRAVRDFLADVCAVEQLADDDDIFAGGFVNSLYLMQLLHFVQKEGGISIEDDDFDMANFHSIQAIVDFLGRKKGDH